jgi:putative transposase
MRKPRVLVEGAWYHVTARVNRGEFCLDHDAVRDLFVVILTRAKKRYRFHVINFCVMGNHIHLLMQPGRNESLSVIMRWLLGGFARAYNKKRGFKGHFWGDRFHSRILDGLRQIAIAFGYIDNNPVKASLVDHPWEWRHGGYWHDLSGNRVVVDPWPPWLAFLIGLRREQQLVGDVSVKAAS